MLFLQPTTMLFNLFSGVAILAFLVGLELASASFAGQIHHAHRHSLRDRPKGRYHQRTSRSAITPCAVSQVDLQAFQVETRAFQEWISTWLVTADKIDSKSAIAQVKQEFQAYNLWAEAWLDSQISAKGPPPSPGNSSIPVTIPITTASTSAQVYISNVVSPVSSDLSAKTSPYLASSPDLPAISIITAAHTAAQQTLPGIVTAIRSSLNSLTATPTPVPSQPKSKSKELVVYYGQTPATAGTNLAQVCENENVDMVILAFLTKFSGPAGYPTINFAAACGGQTQQMLSAEAAGLLSCPVLASYIAKCQAMGKKVLLSLGGSLSNVSLPDDENAKAVAKQLWNLFGAGKGEDPGLRPFGNVTLDGFDIDNEDHSTAHYSTFVSALRENLNTDKSRKYYISAAPQCPRPDASIPLDAMLSMDFIFVQFYNNPSCGLGSSGFIESIQAWSKDLSVPGKTDAGPKLYIGMPGCPVPECSNSGYLGGEELKKTMEEVKKVGVPNFAGVMLWDGPTAMKNHAEGGKDYLAVVKALL